SGQPNRFRSRQRGSFYHRGGSRPARRNGPRSRRLIVVTEAIRQSIPFTEVKCLFGQDGGLHLLVVGTVLAEDRAERLGGPGLLLHPDPPVGQRWVRPQNRADGFR